LKLIDLTPKVQRFKKKKMNESLANSIRETPVLDTISPTGENTAKATVRKSDF
jgi:hypothetical protein